jgi:hypothetical protein
MLGTGALGQLALGQFPITTPSQPDPVLSASSTLLATANVGLQPLGTLEGNGTLLVTATVPGNAFARLSASSSMIVVGYVFQPYNVPIINGWYVDSKGEINYYYRTSDGRNLPRPPIKI